MVGLKWFDRAELAYLICISVHVFDPYRVLLICGLVTDYNEFKSTYSRLNGY